MAFCTNCGAKIDNSAKFCPECGATVSAAKNDKEPWEEEKKDLGTRISEINDTPDTTDEFDPNDVSDNKVMAILSYFSILVLIPLFAAKDSKFARFHANQGLVLFISEIIWSAADGVIVGIIRAISYSLGDMVSSILSLVNLLFLILMIIGIVNAAKGRAKELPIIGKFKILK